MNPNVNPTRQANANPNRANRARRPCGRGSAGETLPQNIAGAAEALRARIGELERRLEELSEERDFLRTQLNNLTFAQGMAAQAQAQKALPNPARRSWWARLLGRG